MEIFCLFGLGRIVFVEEDEDDGMMGELENRIAFAIFSNPMDDFGLTKSRAISSNLKGIQK
jgi:hypothetical protein